MRVDIIEISLLGLIVIKVISETYTRVGQHHFYKINID